MITLFLLCFYRVCFVFLGVVVWTLICKEQKLHSRQFQQLVRLIALYSFA